MAQNGQVRLRPFLQQQGRDGLHSTFSITGGGADALTGISIIAGDGNVVVAGRAACSIGSLVRESLVVHSPLAVSCSVPAVLLVLLLFYWGRTFTHPRILRDLVRCCPTEEVAAAVLPARLEEDEEDEEEEPEREEPEQPVAGGANHEREQPVAGGAHHEEGAHEPGGDEHPEHH